MIKKESAWYKKIVPSILLYLKGLFPSARLMYSIDGVLSVYLWGLVAANIRKKTAKVKSADILVKVSMSSLDMISIIDEASKNLTKLNLLYMGIDPRVYFLTKKYLSLENYNVNRWAISKDNVLMHYGAIPEYGWDLNKLALTGARLNDGFRLQFLHSSPQGWYSLKYNTKNIYKLLIKI